MNENQYMHQRTTSAAGAPASLISSTRQAVLARRPSLDVFRGLTIAAMIVVNSSGNDQDRYPFLRHMPWNGATPTDWIFPFFLFIVGLSMSLSLGAQKARGVSGTKVMPSILRRSVILFALGLIDKWFPFTNFDPSVARIPGVLQRIALCSLIAAPLIWRFELRGRLVAASTIVLSYFAFLGFVPVPGVGTVELTRANASNILSAWVDQLVMGRHLGYGNHTWDANGLVASLSAVASVLCGAALGSMLARPRKFLLVRVIGAGAALAAAGWAWGGFPEMTGVATLGEPSVHGTWVFAINKPLWTSSYVLYTAGIAFLFFAVCELIAAIPASRYVTAPFTALGLNSILVYMLSGILEETLLTVEVAGKSLHRHFYDGVLVPLLGPGPLASVTYPLIFCVTWIVIARILEKRRLFLKI